jgi:hypothetical protein
MAKKNAAPKKTPGKKAAAPKAATAKTKDRKLSQLEAAAKVLASLGGPMNCAEMVRAMAECGLWTSPNGKTPNGTLHASLLREIKLKGKEARFAKTEERGKFTLAK